MQMVGREPPTLVAQLFGSGLAGRAAQVHAHLTQAFRALPQIATRAGCHDIFPACDPTLGPRHHVVERQLALFAAVLAAEPVAQK